MNFEILQICFTDAVWYIFRLLLSTGYTMHQRMTFHIDIIYNLKNTPTSIKNSSKKWLNIATRHFYTKKLLTKFVQTGQIYSNVQFYSKIPIFTFCSVKFTPSKTKVRYESLFCKTKVNKRQTDLSKLCGAFLFNRMCLAVIL